MNKFTINKKNILKQRYIIAEIGINHEGSIERAINLIKSAKRAGANAVKFQAFESETLASADSEKSDLQKKSTQKKESLHKMWKRMEFDILDFRKIKSTCKKIKIDLICSVFDEKSFKIISSVGVDAFKVASSDITDIKLLNLLKKSKKPIILSTGMSNLKEIKRAINILKIKNLYVLHCVSLYPTLPSDINLNRIINLKKALKRPIGFSDHTIGNYSTFAALTLGADIIEKHFTFNKKKIGSDHSISADFKDMKEICNYANSIDKMLGSGSIDPSKKELNYKKFFRKSLYYKNNLIKNSKIRSNDIIIRRPFRGICASQFVKVKGKILKKNTIKNKPITLRDFK